MGEKGEKADVPSLPVIEVAPGGFEGFHDLMQQRVLNVLLVASLYDTYLIEGEGNLSEILLTEYLELNLRFAPRVYRVSLAEDAYKALEEREFDLVITTSRVQDVDAFALAEEIKERNPDLPVVVLSYKTRSLYALMEKGLPECVDHIFAWQGDLRILVAIIKLIEDKMNAERDVKLGGVQVIILIEDSVHFYSTYLPLIYCEIMRQTQLLIAEGMNPAQKYVRQSARPKILLATTYEEALSLFERFKGHILGIVSDVNFPRRGKKDPKAGLSFIKMAKSETADLPIVLQSTLAENKKKADKAKVHFIHKYSPTLLHDLRSFIRENFGFGDFVFRMPDGEEVGRASDIREIVEVLPSIPDRSLKYHAENNHFSNWLKARTEFDLASKIRPITVEQFANISELRDYLVNVFSRFRAAIRHGVVTDFSPETFDSTAAFVRIGSGALGGKASNLAFINRLLARYNIEERFDGAKVIVPDSAVICSDHFEEFMARNELNLLALAETPDEEIDDAIIAGRFPDEFAQFMSVLLERFTFPLAVRSSSLLEDSQELPFAGVYTTVMLPNNHPDGKVRLTQLLNAVKTVYASTYHASAKRYIASSPQRIEEEKMSVIVQELVGRRYDDVFYPAISGIARSYNFYALDKMKPEDGVASLAIGLGKYIVEGGSAWRFCPKYPKTLPPFETAEKLAAATQRSFYALNLDGDNHKLVFRGDENIATLDLEVAEAQGTLTSAGSTYSVDNDRLYDGITRKGMRIVTFAHILKNKLYPVSEIIENLLETGSESMGAPVEIEFAVNLPDDRHDPAQFAVVQIRQLATGEINETVNVDRVEPGDVVCFSNSSLGNGVFDKISNIVYLKPDAFDPSRTKEMAKQIGSLNKKLLESGLTYILIGPGRWGSRDSWLGVPVKWGDISSARILVEVSLDNFKIEPSQGTHFFHNITAFEMGYLTVHPKLDGSSIDWEWLAGVPAVYENEFIRHVATSEPVTVLLDGLRGKGCILRPGARIEGT